MTAVGEAVRIMIVEDDPDIRDLLEVVLASKGYAVRKAADGQEGLEEMTRFRPDLIMLDLAMPKLDGIGFLKAKSKVYEDRDIPVIVLSARDKNTDVMQAVEMGADNYIIKPFDIALVVASIERLLPPRRLAAD